MYFDRWDICTAYYFWLQHNWSGKSCPHYVRWCALSQWFSLGAGMDMDDMSENARVIYDNIGEV